MTTLEEIKESVRRSDPNEDEQSESFKAQVVLLASLVVGPSVPALRKYTGYPWPLLHKFNYRLRHNGVWNRGKVHANWFDEPISFHCDTLVALGMMDRVP